MITSEINDILYHHPDTRSLFLASYAVDQLPSSVNEKFTISQITSTPESPINSTNSPLAKCEWISLSTHFITIPRVKMTFMSKMNRLHSIFSYLESVQLFGWTRVSY